MTAGLVGMLVSATLLGSPPAHLVPDGTDLFPAECRPDRASETVALLEVVDDSTMLQPARCFDGLRVWGAPLWPTSRDRWLAATEQRLRNELLPNALLDLRAKQEAIETEVERGARALQSRIDAAVADGRDASEILELAGGTRAAELRSLEWELSEIAATSAWAQELLDEGVLLPPTSGIFSVVVGAIAGIVTVLATREVTRLLQWLSPRLLVTARKLTNEHVA